MTKICLLQEAMITNSCSGKSARMVISPSLALASIMPPLKLLIGHPCIEAFLLRVVEPLISALDFGIHSLCNL